MSDRGMTILVADDSETVLMYSSVLLRRMGFDVISAKDGEEALDLIKSLSPDIAVLDNVMPGMAGVEVLRQIRKDDDFCSMPVVMLTVDGSADTREICTQLGCAEFLTKPLHLSKLHRAVEKCVKISGGPERRHLRSAFSKKIYLKYNGVAKSLYAVSLSTGGIFVRAMDPLPLGTDVEVTIPLQDDHPITLRGRVIYTKALYGDVIKISPGMGVEFVDIAETEKERVGLYVNKLLAEDIIDEQESSVITIDSRELSVGK